jgi:AraC-like DNA-binding protein
MQSNHRAPSPELERIVARHYVFSVDLPDDFELIDNLLSETAFIRILVKGDWAAIMPDGSFSNVGPMVLFGANTKPFAARCKGSFNVIGIAIRPAGWPTLFDESAQVYSDRMVALADAWGDDSRLLHDAVLAAGNDLDDLVAAIEGVLLQRLARRPRIEPDPKMIALEEIARFESTVRIGEVCSRLGLSERVLQRRCQASFGMTPKRLMRRSRFLDMASVMRGLFDPSEEVLAQLRYFDQSHLTREFREFSGMTPRKFAKTPTPLLTAGLELRNGFRYSNPAGELLDRG